jgi:nitrite reductase/ring-hydroxylating ferredoxin subunit
MNDAGWLELAGTDPHAEAFPVSARFGEEPIWVFRTDGGYFGVQDRCPHLDRTLDTARIVGGGSMIRCGHHNYTFRLSNGAGVNFPTTSIAVYDVKEEDGKLFARRRPSA